MAAKSCSTRWRMRVATRPLNSPWRSAARAWSEAPGATATSAADGRALAELVDPPAASTSGLPPSFTPALERGRVGQDAGHGLALLAAAAQVLDGQGVARPPGAGHAALLVPEVLVDDHIPGSASTARQTARSSPPRRSGRVSNRPPAARAGWPRPPSPGPAWRRRARARLGRGRRHHQRPGRRSGPGQPPGRVLDRRRGVVVDPQRVPPDAWATARSTPESITEPSTEISTRVNTTSPYMIRVAPVRKRRATG